MPLAKNFLAPSALSCRLIYRMNGLHSTLVSLRDICVEGGLAVHRVNALYVPTDLSVIINMGDTMLQAPTTPRRPGREPPMVLWQRLGELVLVADLDEYKSESARRDPDLADVPFLQYRSLARIPLCRTDDYVFLLNFWSQETGAFSPGDLADLQTLTAPLAEELGANLSTGLGIRPSAASRPRSSRERLDLCSGLADARRLVEQVAPTASTVLIIGETGSGKEAVADAIHELSPRRDGPLIKVNCGAIPESLLDSELFGYEKGAFTGAAATRRGYFEAANGGTLVLDEIGEMSLSAQVRLLRVLESGFVTRVGNPEPLPLDVRVVAATHADLRVRVAEGTFRKDLWYRLSVFPIFVPPLRQRKEDIPALVRHFMDVKAEKLNLRGPVSIPEAEMTVLLGHDWPGNVRELEHVVERALIRASGLHGRVRFDIDPLPAPANGGGDAVDQGWPSLEELENRYVRAVLRHCGGKLTGPGGAAELLGVHYTTLRAYMRRLGLPMPREKGGSGGAARD